MEADKLLYNNFLKGDNAAFESLVLKYKDNLICFLQRYVKDIYTCEDIAQDVFAYIYTYKNRYDSKLSFKTFIFSIGKHKAVDHIRKHSKLISLSDQIDDAADLDELFLKVVQDEEKRLVHTCMMTLKSEYQSAIYLIDFEDLTYKEAANVLGKTVPQFRILIYRARQALKQALEKGGYTHEK